jgi:predicted GH43/DUF377 family glycosyl hydrolase
MGKIVLSVWLLPRLRRGKAFGNRQPAIKEIMKKLIFNLILSLFILVLSGCKQNNFPAPLKFKGYENNPVLVPGEPGSWDDLNVFCCCILEYDDTIYLYYTAHSKTGNRSLGLATSTDGYYFTKFKGNPILTGDKKGYDAFGVGQAGILKEDSLWVLYFNGREIAGYASGPSFGRATAKLLQGPWTKSEEPVLTTGRRGEWDSDFISNPVLVMDNGSYRMYYSGGEDLVSYTNVYIGMATSEDGITWRKFNNPVTRQHPFVDSDPVMLTGKPGEWDYDIVLTGPVLPINSGFEMYYYGSVSPKTEDDNWEAGSIGYATSEDGIHWERYKKNPVYSVEDDPYYFKMSKKEAIIHNPKILVKDSLCILYYDYGAGVNSAISMAIAEVR